VKVLHLLLVLRAIYECIQSALLWYDLYVNTLEKSGWVINPYDCCVANNVINGSQATLVWFVDDNKLCSHIDPQVNTQIINDINKHFGELVVTRGKKHCFLGMNLEIKDIKIEMDMVEQIREAIETFGEDISEKVVTPAARRLHYVDKDDEQLGENQSVTFHSVTTAKLLFIMKRAQPDIETSVALSISGKQDWLKLKRVLQF